ncbi:MAG TPA: copper-binding protein [Pyrinomonadaceae bacterium]|nr:copper-binding protein [Pyrinomonadaceae bacterium]
MNTAFRKPFARNRSGLVVILAIIMGMTIALLIAGCQKSPPTENTNHAERPAPTKVIATGPPGFPPPVMDKPYPATGIVALINKKEGWIEINHDEIKDLMPAMQMEFWVKDNSLLDKVKVGDRVDFTVVETKKGEYLTEIKRSSTAATPPK